MFVAAALRGLCGIAAQVDSFEYTMRLDLHSWRYVTLGNSSLRPVSYVQESTSMTFKGKLSAILALFPGILRPLIPM